MFDSFKTIQIVAICVIIFYILFNIWYQSLAWWDMPKGWREMFETTDFSKIDKWFLQKISKDTGLSTLEIQNLMNNWKTLKQILDNNK